MKHRIFLITLVFMGLFVGCGKKNDVNRTAPPHWTVDESGKYPATMTAVVQVPPSLQKNKDASDELGAFIGGECRGLGERVNLDSTSAFFVMIRGESSETDKIQFKYYSGHSSRIYETAPFLDFVLDANFGSAAKPAVLELKP